MSHAIFLANPRTEHCVQTNDSHVLEQLGNTEGFKLSFQTHMVQRWPDSFYLPGKDDLFTWLQWGEVVEGAELGGRWVAKRLGPKVKLTLLVGHEAGCCKESRPVWKKGKKKEEDR